MIGNLRRRFRRAVEEIGHGSFFWLGTFLLGHGIGLWSAGGESYLTTSEAVWLYGCLSVSFFIIHIYLNPKLRLSEQSSSGVKS